MVSQASLCHCGHSSVSLLLQVQDLMQQMQDKFQNMSDQVINRNILFALSNRNVEIYSEEFSNCCLVVLFSDILMSNVHCLSNHIRN